MKGNMLKILKRNNPRDFCSNNVAVVKWVISVTPRSLNVLYIQNLTMILL